MFTVTFVSPLDSRYEGEPLPYPGWSEIFSSHHHSEMGKVAHLEGEVHPYGHPVDLAMEEDEAFASALRLVRVHQEAGEWGTITVQKTVGIGRPDSTVAWFTVYEDGHVQAKLAGEPWLGSYVD